MRRSLALVLTLVLALGTPGCLYSHITRPLDIDVNNTQLGDKIGKASFKSVLWLFAWGDAGTHAAALEGDLDTVQHMDVEVLSVLFGLYYKQTTIVYGD